MDVWNTENQKTKKAWSVRIGKPFPVILKRVNWNWVNGKKVKWNTLVYGQLRFDQTSIQKMSNRISINWKFDSILREEDLKILKLKTSQYFSKKQIKEILNIDLSYSFWYRCLKELDSNVRYSSKTENMWWNVRAFRRKDI